MIQAEVANEANYTKRALPPQHRMWFRRAYNERAHGTAKATISTFLGTKIDSTSRTDILDDIAS
jgi:hypothetical protein